MANKNQQSKQKLQEQVSRLGNEIEELRLEREESKKNVIHFMQEADAARQELYKTQALLADMTRQLVTQNASTTPNEHEDQRQDDHDDGDGHWAKMARLLMRLYPLDANQLDHLFTTVTTDRDTLEDQVKQTQAELARTEEQLTQIKDQLKEQRRQTTTVTEERDSLKRELAVERDRIAILERRWQESESGLEQAEAQIHQLERQVSQWRQQALANKVKVPVSTISQADLDERDRKIAQGKEREDALQANLANVQQQLAQQTDSLTACQQKCAELEQAMAVFQSKQLELEQARMRENHLKSVNKTLRDEIRKATRQQAEPVNIEYIRNVVLKFIEKKESKAEMIPILSSLLQCSAEEQVRLEHIVRNKKSSS